MTLVSISAPRTRGELSRCPGGTGEGDTARPPGSWASGDQVVGSDDEDTIGRYSYTRRSSVAARRADAHAEPVPHLLDLLPLAAAAQLAGLLSLVVVLRDRAA